MLLEVPPADKRSRKTGRMKKSYWQAALGPEVLGHCDFGAKLLGYNREKLTPEVMMEVEGVLARGDYSYENAHTACKAAEGIFQWVKGTREAFYIYKEIAPRREAFFASESQWEDKKRMLQEKRAEIRVCDGALEQLKIK
jgi:hypothetical protein